MSLRNPSDSNHQPARSDATSRAVGLVSREVAILLDWTFLICSVRRNVGVVREATLKGCL